MAKKASTYSPSAAAECCGAIAGMGMSFTTAKAQLLDVIERATTATQSGVLTPDQSKQIADIMEECGVMVKDLEDLHRVVDLMIRAGIATMKPKEKEDLF